MATGILGTANPTASTDTVVYTVPASKVAVVTLNISNISGTPGTMRVALSSTSTPTASEYIEYDIALADKVTVERTGIVLNATKNVVVNLSCSCSVVVYGYEENA